MGIKTLAGQYKGKFVSPIGNLYPVGLTNLPLYSRANVLTPIS